ncbi:hypothetical protein EAE89_05670 [Photorhabdus heterorhabditis]|nr:hypothetical protein [Photorhabdus heterorhabditis]
MVALLSSPISLSEPDCMRTYFGMQAKLFGTAQISPNPVSASLVGDQKMSMQCQQAYFLQDTQE